MGVVELDRLACNVEFDLAGPCCSESIKVDGTGRNVRTGCRLSLEGVDEPHPDGLRTVPLGDGSRRAPARPGSSSVGALPICVHPEAEDRAGGARVSRCDVPLIFPRLRATSHGPRLAESDSAGRSRQTVYYSATPTQSPHQNE